MVTETETLVGGCAQCDFGCEVCDAQFRQMRRFSLVDDVHATRAFGVRFPDGTVHVKFADDPALRNWPGQTYTDWDDFTQAMAVSKLFTMWWDV